MDNENITKHANWRIRQRNIPQSLVEEAIKRGKRVILLDRNAIEYRLNNILGIRGRHLIVITSNDGKVLTSYMDIPEKQKQRRNNMK